MRSPNLLSMMQCSRSMRAGRSVALLSGRAASEAWGFPVSSFASCRYNGINAEYQAIAKELEKTNAEFKEFERKDIKYRQAGREELRRVLLSVGRESEHFQPIALQGRPQAP